MSYDIDLLNDAGEVLLSFKDFVTLPLEGISTVDNSAVAEESEGVYLYDTIWQESLLCEVPEQSSFASGLILLAGGPAILADHLKESLEIEVELIGGDTPESYFVDVLDKVKEKLVEKGSCELVLVYQNSDYTDYGFVSGLLKTAVHENPRFRGRTIGVDSLSIQHRQELIGILEAEQNSKDIEVRYKDGKREVKTLERIPELLDSQGSNPIKEGGVYLITGGAGGLGLIFAEYISRTKDTRVILTGRTEPGLSLKETLLKLPNAVYHRCDVSNKPEVFSLIDMIKSTYSKLDGVIHSAGVIRDSFIVRKTKEELHQVLSPKISGVKNLDEATRDEALDFMVYFSSIAGVLGNVGQSDYASANAYLDNYAQYRTGEQAKGHRHGRTLSINWPLWEEGGMQVDAEAKKHMETQWGILPLPAEAGCTAFETLLKNNSNQGIVAFGKASKIVNILLKEETKIEKPLNVLVPIGDELSKLKAASISYIRGLLCKELRLPEDRLELDAPFEKYGIDSILISKLTNRLEEVFGQIPKTLFFEYQTLGELVEYFIEKHTFRLQEVTDHFAENGASSLSTEVDLKKLTSKNTRIAYRNNKNIRIKDFLKTEDIAVVALGGMFSEAYNPSQLWSKVALEKVMEKAVKVNGTEYFYGPVKETYEIDIIERLGFTKNSFSLLSRQQQMIFSVLGQAMDENDITIDDLSSKTTGVFIGAQEVSEDKNSLVEQNLDNNLSYLIPNKVSFQLNLKGPSEIVNTYCTSVYVALHRAIQSIKSGECDQAIVGGVNVISENDFKKGVNTEMSELLSIDKRTKSFCDDGTGFVRSEGAGILIIKSLKQAKVDSNRILALIKGSSVKHGGRGFSLEAPNAKGIKEVIRTSIRNAGIDSATIDYIEAHGIANRMADAIELGAISDAYNELSSNPDKKWHISSIKPTVGHTELASGMASIIKTIYALQNKIIPGIPGLDILNKEFDPAHSMILKSESAPWINGKYPRRVALNGYAVGGVNAHIILEEYKVNEDFNSSDIIKIEDSILSAETKNLESEQLESQIDQKYIAILSSLSQEIFKMDLDSIDKSSSPIDYNLDSVQMIQFTRRINETLNLNIKMGQILGVDNFSDLFNLLEKEWLSGMNSNQDREITEVIDLEKLYAVSEGQKGLWFVQHLEPDNTAFNIPIAFSFAGKANHNDLEETLKLVLNDYPILRANFIEHQDTGEIFHKINDIEKSLFLDYCNIENRNNINEEFWQLLRKPFNLKEDSLVRLYIRYDQSENKTYILFVIHHIVFDGTSAILFVKLFMSNYQKFLKGDAVVSKEQDLAYFDFVEWEKQYTSSQEGEENMAYWREKFPDRLPVLALPYDSAPSIELKTKKVGCEIEIIKKTELDQLKKLARDLNVNLSVLLLSVFNVLLHRLTGEEDIVVLTPTAGRPKQKHEQSIGFYVNMMMTRNTVSSKNEFNTLVKDIKKEFINGISNAAYPFPKLISELKLNGANSRMSNFQAFYAFQNIFDKNADDEMILIERLSDQFQETEEEYSMEIFDLHEELVLNLKYNQNLFKASTIKRHLGYFKQLLTGIIEDPNKIIKDYEILSKEEKQLLLVDWNDTSSDFSKEKTIIDLFEEQVNNSPEAIAVVFEDTHLTYNELNNKANQLGHYLIEQGIREGSLISICVERSLEMIIGILGVLKAGAAFIPVDPEYPNDRIAYMLDDSDATLVLSTSTSRKKIETKPDLHIVELDTDWNTINEKEKINPQIERKGKNLAYIIYTSGSTGKPKGVMIEHSGLVNLFISLSKEIGFGSNSSIFSLATFSFDMSYVELFLPLMVGGKFFIIKKDIVQDGFKLIEKIDQYRPTHLEATPSGWQLLVNCGWKNKEDIKILIGGEALNEKIKAELTKTGKIWNLYGPTETTIWSTIKRIGSDDVISVGKPLANTKIYILEKEGCHLRPIGVSGEICIGGAGLARGYLNLPTLTTEKFIPNPFIDETNSRLYRTGDLGRWLDDGNIEYIGRIDEQVKIRGYRIELGEIESVLLQSNLVSQAVIVVKGQEDSKHLAAYVVPNEKFNRSEIIKFLNNRLPQYMIPMIVELEKLPLTPNGKIDRRSLPDMNNLVSYDYVAPRNELEEKLAKTWEELLNIERVGVNDNFFELGGHSLLATRLVSAIQKQGYSISLQDVFNASTLSDLAIYLDSSVLSFEEKINILLGESEGILSGKIISEGSHTDIVKEQNNHYENYINDAFESIDIEKTNDYNHILLLGATGYLGMHLLHDLLQKEEQQITVVVRPEKSQSANIRMENMYQYYFEQSLAPYLKKLHILEGDVTNECFGLTEEIYLKLQNEVDVILNSAAYTKHYGDKIIFDKVNVRLIQHMIDFVKNQSYKAHIHHVSTMGIIGMPSEKKDDVFSEFDIDKGQLLDTVYQKSKLKAEVLLNEARADGLSVSIYRVSNLTFHSKTGKFQSNPEDNAFYTVLRSFLEIGVIPKIDRGFDVSCIDWISEAVISMMNKKELLNFNWQIKDPARLSTKLFAQTAEDYGFKIKEVDYIDFLKFIRDNYSKFEVAIDNVVLHTGIMKDKKSGETFHVRNDLTNRVMEMLELDWDNPDESSVVNMLDHATQTGFFERNMYKEKMV
nr:non-ribosomal peptide synthetase [Flavobacterium sp. H122]